MRLLCFCFSERLSLHMRNRTGRTKSRAGLKSSGTAGSRRRPHSSSALRGNRNSSANGQSGANNLLKNRSRTGPNSPSSSEANNPSSSEPNNPGSSGPNNPSSSGPPSLSSSLSSVHSSRLSRGSSGGEAQQGAWQGHSTWQQDRAQHWDSDHRSWAQRGGYGGYYIPQNRFAVYFGSDHWFRLRSVPTIYNGYPRFAYGGYSFLLVDPWPEYWASDWYATDDVYIDYDDGYYLYNRRYPYVRLAVTVAM